METGRLGRRGRGPRFAAMNYWPGFVDALSNLLLVITFLLSIFMLAQFVMGAALSGRDAQLKSANAELTDLAAQLGLAQSSNDALQQRILELSATLETEKTRAVELQSYALTIVGELGERTQQLGQASDALQLYNRQIAALSQQLLALQEALAAAQERDRQSQAVIENLGRELNAALAQKVQELARYRSEFFGRLREALGDREDLRIVGDRFVFQSEVLFDSGSAEINPEGRDQLGKLAGALRDIAAKIPADVNWVLRVDGHSDRRPIATAAFPTNWHLSAARAISVVQFLTDQGVPAERLVAAGFGEYNPIAAGEGDDAFRQNRRIEFKLTER